MCFIYFSILMKNFFDLHIPKTPFETNKCWGRNYSYTRHTAHNNIQQLYFRNLGHLNHIHFVKCTFCKLCCIRYTCIRDRLKILIGIKLVVNQLWFETIACFGVMIIFLLELPIFFTFDLFSDKNLLIIQDMIANHYTEYILNLPHISKLLEIWN